LPGAIASCYASCMIKKELDRVRYLQNPRRQAIIRMRLDGMTYKAAAEALGISRQRAEQLASPPRDILNSLIARAQSRCESCGILVGRSGHAHHKGQEEEDYGDVNQLAYLCISCHHRAHGGERSAHRICEQCGKEFWRIHQATGGESGSGSRFCSKACRSTGAKVSLVCEQCGKHFERGASIVRGNLKKGQRHIWCSKKCQGVWLGRGYGKALAISLDGA
jgi:hypothetical protein